MLRAVDRGMSVHHINGMAKSKVTISLDTATLRRLDRMVADGQFPSRSQAIQAAVEEKLERLDRRLMTRECVQLDRAFERAVADEGLSADTGARPEH